MDLFKHLYNKKVLFIFPHPDDESYSSVSLITRLLKQAENIYLIYISCGSPTRKNYITPLSKEHIYEKYIALRQKEWFRAMRILGLRNKQFGYYNYPSRALKLNIPIIVEKLSSHIGKYKIDVVFCSPFEGAHPDHDVCSFIATRLGKIHHNIKKFEYTGYHLKNGKFMYADFLKKKNMIFTIKLTPEELKAKARLLRTYKSQSEILKNFRSKTEKFRPQPAYNYLVPPSNEIYYTIWSKKDSPRELIKLFEKYR